MNNNELLNSYLITYPVNLREDEIAMLTHMVTHDLSILWNGEDLRGRTFVGTRFLVHDRRNPELLTTEAVHSCVDKKLLIKKVHERQNKPMMIVNPIIEKLIKHDVPNSFDFGDKKVELFARIDYSIPDNYLKPFSKAIGEKISKSFYKLLMEKGVVLNYIFKMENKYFVFKNNLLQEVKPVFMKNQFKINNLPKDSETDLSKEGKEKAEEMSKKIMENLDIDNIIKESLDNSENLKKEEQKAKELLEKQEKERKEKENLEKEKAKNIDKPIFETNKIDEESLKLGYSISKFKKPIKKVSVDFTKDFEGRFRELVAFYIKNYDVEMITQRELNELKDLIAPYSTTAESISIIQDKVYLKKYLDYYLSKFKYDINDCFGIKVHCSENKFINSNKLPKDSSKDVLFIVHKKRKTPNNMLHRFYLTHSQFPDTCRDDFSMLGVMGASAHLYKESLYIDVLNHGNFTKKEEEFLKAVCYGDYVRMRALATVTEEELNVKDFYEKAYYSLYTIFIDRISQDNKYANRKETESYARSFEDKKHITLQNQKVMEDNAFLTRNFKYVELDNDADLNRFSVLEKEYLNIKDKLPKLPVDIDLRFRKLGNIRVGSKRGAGGVYYPSLNTLCVDLDNTSSFVHEYGHAFDFLTGGAYTPLSNGKDFQYIVNKYRKELVSNNNDMASADLSYFCDSAEVFARGFELYMLDTLPFNNLMKPDLTEPQYKALDVVEDEITKYFSNLLK